MSDRQIILLPKDDYYTWLDAAKDYATTFGANFTNDLTSAGRYAVITVAAVPGAYDEPDIVAWLQANFPQARLDVIRVNTPEALTQALAPRIASGEQLPAALSIPTPAPAPQPSRGIVGTLRLDPDKARFAARIENIIFIEEITNLTDQVIPYGVLGVKVTRLSGEGQDFFHTSWSGKLSLGPRCKGPTDSCGGEWRDMLKIDQPGTYRLTMDICYSSVEEAVAGRGDWETLTPGIEISVVNWEPPT
jgi:hypothetical protein